MTNSSDTALSLMRMAMSLLDKNGEGASSAACHLQAAIEAAMGTKPMQEGDELNDKR